MVGQCEIFTSISLFSISTIDGKGTGQGIKQCEGDVWSIYPRFTMDLAQDTMKTVKWFKGLPISKQRDLVVSHGDGGPMATIVANWDDEENHYDVERVSGTPSPSCSY